MKPAPSGPGFFEIGEELALASAPDGLLSAVVVAGEHGAALETAAFSPPPAATVTPKTAETPTSRPRESPGESGRATPGTPAPRAGTGRPTGFAADAAWPAAAGLFFAVAAGGALLL